MKRVQAGLVYAMGIDPGGTTGWSIIGIDRAALESRERPPIDYFTSGHVTGNYTKQVLALRTIANWYHDPFYTLAIITESFDPRKPIRTEEYFSPIYLNARIQFLSDTGRLKPPLFYQTPSEAMKVATNARLKKWGLYEPGEEHPKDATRHAITFIRRCQDEPALAREAWPTISDADTARIPQYLPEKHGKVTPMRPR